MKNLTTPDGKKRCCRCEVFRPREDFGANKSNADGLARMCRECKRQADRRVSPASTEGDSDKQRAPDVEPGTIPQRKYLGTGRPSKCTEETIEAICANLAKGHTRRAAAAAAGIGESTFHDWMARGRDAREACLEKFLVEAVALAEGDGMHALEQQQIDAARVDPLVGRFLLERRFNADWGRKEQVTVANDNKPLEVTLVRELIFKRVAALQTPVDSGGDRHGAGAGSDSDATAPRALESPSGPTDGAPPVA